VKSAKALLEDGCLEIWQIAEEIGYRNVTTFARNFRKVEGTSPKRYQRLHRSLRIDRVTTRNAEKYARNAEKNTRTSNIPDG
jgi:AraC-like DNA-binding protein